MAHFRINSSPSALSVNTTNNGRSSDIPFNYLKEKKVLGKF